MGPGGFGGFCLALLCSGAALGFQEEEPVGNGDVTEETPDGTLGPPEPPGNVTEETLEGTPGPPKPPGHPSSVTGRGDEVTTRPRVTTSSAWSGDPAVTPAGNRTRKSSAVPARYWSPVLFVLLALLVLFVTYHRTKDKGIRDRAMGGSDSSDLGALVQPHLQEPSPEIPALQREGKDPETPPALEHSETSFSQPVFPGKK